VVNRLLRGDHAQSIPEKPATLVCSQSEYKSLLKEAFLKYLRIRNTASKRVILGVERN